MPGEPPATDRVASIRDVIRAVALRSAHHNELRLSQIRVVIIGLSLAVNLIAWRWPGAVGLAAFDVRMVHVAAACLGFTLVELAAVARGPFSPWLPSVLALGDVGLIFLFARNLDLAGLIPVLDYSGEACTVLALTGAARGTVAAALWTTGLAIVTTIGAGAMIGVHPLGLVLRGTLVVGAGLLGVWLSALVQRARERDIGRAILPRFLPGAFVDRIHQDPDALVAAAATVRASVLFVDLRGFTTIAERCAPRDAFALLNRVHGELSEIVGDAGGHVDKFLGDGLLAVFGAHGAQPDHARRAVDAAVRIAALDVDLGVGVHTGDVLAGVIGGDRRLEFTVIGDAVNTAARLEQLTKEHATRVLVSAETLREVDGELAARFAPLGAVAVRGRQASVEVFRLDPR